MEEPGALDMPVDETDTFDRIILFADDTMFGRTFVEDIDILGSVRLLDDTVESEIGVLVKHVDTLQRPTFSVVGTLDITILLEGDTLEITISEEEAGTFGRIML